MATLMVVYNDGAETVELKFENAWEVLHKPGEEMPDILSKSNTEILNRVQSLVPGMTGEFTVVRPNTGNILISPKTVFG